MLQTALGTIYFTINGKKYEYQEIELPNKGKCFRVDKRYKVSIENIPNSREDIIIECILQANGGCLLECYPETGEDLALISFTFRNTKLSIGTLGDINNVTYDYLKDRMVLKIHQGMDLKEIVFYIAWMTMRNIEEEDIYTWFAADPTL